MIRVTKAGIALCFGTLLGGDAAYADDVAITTGYTYYLEGGLATTENTGWHKDGIDAGFQLVLKGDEKLDLVSTGNPPNDFKYSDHGCKLASGALSSDQNGLTVMALCPRQIEVFLFQRKNHDAVEVVRVDVSLGITKHGGALHADCRSGAH